MQLLTYYPAGTDPLSGSNLRCGISLQEAYKVCTDRVGFVKQQVENGERLYDEVTRRLINKYQYHADAIQVLMLSQPQLVTA